MPIPLPNLDDRRYEDIVAEALRRIPAIAPQWTNHNPSDPGIALVELLAWLTEMVIFRLNEIPDENIGAFLELLRGEPLTEEQSGDLSGAIRETVLGLRARFRAVTPEDFERLTLGAWPDSREAAPLAEDARILRARCLAGRRPGTDGLVDAPGHVTLVVVPHPPAGRGAERCAQLWRFLDERRLLTTRHHVVEPRYQPITIGARLVPHADAKPSTVLDTARRALADLFDPLTGGPEGRGWPFGRAVYASEIYAALDRLPLIDYVENVMLYTEGSASRAVVALDDDNLVTADPSGLRVVDIDGYEIAS